MFVRTKHITAAKTDNMVRITPPICSFMYSCKVLRNTENTAVSANVKSNDITKSLLYTLKTMSMDDTAKNKMVQINATGNLKTPSLMLP